MTSTPISTSTRFQINLPVATVAIRTCSRSGAIRMCFSPSVQRISKQQHRLRTRRQEEARREALEIVIGGARAGRHIYWSCLLTGGGSDRFVLYFEAIQLLGQSKHASSSTNPHYLCLFLFVSSERPPTQQRTLSLAVSNPLSRNPFSAGRRVGEEKAA